MSRFVWPLLVLFTAGCPSSGPSFMGEPGSPIQAILDSNLFFLPTTVDGVEGPHLALDTGAPTVVVAPERLTGLTEGLNEAKSFKMLDLEFVDFEYIADDILSADMDGFVAGGVIGCTAFCSFDVSLDYRNATVVLDAPNPTDTIEAHDIDVSLEGGGRARDRVSQTVFEVPRSRVIVDANVEGVDLRLLVDTGASATVLRAGLSTNLLSDGRPSLDAPATGMFGMDTAKLFRVRELSIGGAALTDVIVARSPAFDTLLDGIAAETGSRIDGVVGGTVLREFYVTIAYETERLLLDRYASREHIRDEALRVGVLVTRVQGTYVEVGEVVAGTDAVTQGVAVGDRITAIDGTPIEGKSDVQVALLLAGTKGAARNLTFGCDGCSGFNGARTVAVDYDILALP